MTDFLTVTLVQTNVVWHDAGRNRDHFEELIRPSLGPSDIVILPETFCSGFTQAPQEVAQGMDGENVSWMRGLAEASGTAICGSLAMEDGGEYFNRFVFADPEGALHYYDKRHRFGLGGETERYSAGAERVVFEYRGWRIFPQVCYDLRFPVFSRNDLGYDLAIYVANWPTPRTHAWRTLLRARAIENQCFVAAVNRVGKDGNGISYSGASAAIGPDGIDLCDLGEIPDVRTVSLDKNFMDEFRTRFPFLEDRDAFSLDL